jgi:dephospho-CoA kinase
MTFRLGLTGGIGMGKSTTAAMFADAGLPVWDADAVVHSLYTVGGPGVALIGELVPSALDGAAVSRPKLRTLIANDPTLLGQVEALIHPLVAADRAAFLAKAARHPIVLLDIPLLYETGADADCDGVVVVSVPPVLQRVRVLSRGAITPAQLDLILSRQMPDAERRARATWVIDTTTLDSARAAVAAILATIRQDPTHA